jgi:hypothetical protein
MVILNIFFLNTMALDWPDNDSALIEGRTLALISEVDLE